MRNITLVGFMGTGKTTVGRKLAHKLGYKFIDSDEEIVREKGISVTQIFSEFGEPYFREVEMDVLKRLSCEQGLIISAGGGAVINAENVYNLRRSGPVVCLTATPESIYQRVRHSSSRPLLMVEDPLGRIKELLDMRAPFYARADVTVDTSGLSADEVADRILELISEAL